jgi:hypothetical protein
MGTDYTLAYGTHASPEEGRCAMEWVSYLAGEPHSDEPATVSKVLRSFCIALNDGLTDGPRQRLRPFLARTIGTADDGLDGARSWMAMDWLIRTYAATWLDLAGLDQTARRVASLPAVEDSRSLAAALIVLTDARREARAAWSAAVGAPRATTWAPWLAGRAAARETAWGVAGAAGWAAARVAVGDMAGDRARAIVRDIAGDAAATVAREGGAGLGRAAARRAAREALAPVIDRLQVSIFDLLDRMLPTVPLEMPVVRDAATFSAPIVPA